MTLKKLLSTLLVSASLVLAYTMYDFLTRRNEPADESLPVSRLEAARPNFPVTYSLGSFDSRFGISQERFLVLAAEAKKIWEDAAGKSLFESSEHGTMKINLIYDARQENLLKAQAARAGLDEEGRSFDQLQADYNAKARALDESRSALEEASQASKSHLEEYNARVARWNESKEHSDAEYTSLQARRKELEEEQSVVEKKAAELNSRGEELNKLGESMNQLAGKHNLEVEKFNGRFINSRDFEKGVFDGKAINIYEFEKEDDLKLALVHEFGHAIGLGHIDNPKAIMCPKIALQDLSDIRLTTDDLNLLLARLK